MKELFLTVAVVCFALMATPSTVSASAEQGQRLFKMNFRKACGFSGVRFARNHTQEEWQEIYEANNLPQETKKLCPRLKLETIKDEWWSSIYDFSYEYASNSSHMPKC